MSEEKPILVVDDNAANRKLSQLQLKKMGFESETVVDGPSAISLLRAKHTSFSLVLMDCHMPGISGFEAVRTLRQENIGIPIIGFTASNDPADIALAEQSGMTAFVSRPVQLQGLRSVIEKVLTGKSDFSAI